MREGRADTRAENKDARRQAGIPEHSVFEFAACRQRAAVSLARH